MDSQGAWAERRLPTALEARDDGADEATLVEGQSRLDHVEICGPDVSYLDAVRLDGDEAIPSQSLFGSTVCPSTGNFWLAG